MLTDASVRSRRALFQFWTCRGWKQAQPPVSLPWLFRRLSRIGLISHHRCALPGGAGDPFGSCSHSWRTRDEGLLKPLDWFFAIKGGHQPFAGCGLVLGSDDEGETVSARVALQELKRRILHLRIVGKSPIRFLAWDAVHPTPGPMPMTLHEIEGWMAADLPRP